MFSHCKLLGCFVALTLAFASSHAESESPPPNPSSAGQDRATPAELAAAIRAANTIVVEFTEFTPGKTRHLDALVTDADWTQQLASMIESASLTPKPYCFCVSSPDVALYESGKPVLRLSLHHGSKLRLLGRYSADFDIGAERATALLTLLQQQRPHARERELPPSKERR